MKKAWTLSVLTAGFAFCQASAQNALLTSTRDLPVRTDSATTALIDSLLDAKCKITAREKDSTTFKLMLYPANSDHISFFEFSDINNNDIYERSELSYAELADAFTDIVVENDAQDSIALKTRVIDRKLLQGPAWQKAKAVYDRHPAPLKSDPAAVAQWIIDRNTRKPE